MATRRAISRASFILVATLVCLLLTSVLAWQAFDAVASQRAVAESVLKDYAALAADEYIRRTASQVGAYGYYPLLNALAAFVQRQGSLPTGKQLLEELPDRSRRAAELGRSLFAVPYGAREAAMYSGDEPPVEKWLREAMPALAAGSPDTGSGLPVLHHNVAGHERSFVYRRIREPQDTLVGFEVDRAALSSWFAEAFEGAPLLPPSLTRADDAAGRIFISVTDDAGEVIFRSAKSPDDYLAVHRPFGTTYGRIFEGGQVVASVDPDAAALLVIGGLPETRLPLLLALILLTLGLFTVTILLLRREWALTQLRSDFVSRVSHELRTPLTQIRIFAETLLLGRVRSEEERKRSLEIIDRESRRLTHLVENLLEFSRHERGTTKLAPRPQALAPLIHELVQEFRPLVSDRDVRFVTRLEEAVVPVDEDAFRQVLLNLLDNAVKYGPMRQEIDVASRRIAGYLQITVDDEGPGIPPGERERIWERFHRLDREHEPAQAGTGIGLAVVRELVQLHVVRTRVEAGARGVSRFVVVLCLPFACLGGDQCA